MTGSKVLISAFGAVWLIVGVVFGVFFSGETASAQIAGSTQSHLIASWSANSTIGLANEQGAKPLAGIEVTAPKDVTSVQALNDTLSALSQHVTACVKAGRNAETCQCSDPRDLTSLRKGFESLIKQHPDWKDQLLSYRYVNQEGRNISGTLVLQNLRRQLEVLKCK
jgi:hypothetical protein